MEEELKSALEARFEAVAYARGWIVPGIRLPDVAQYLRRDHGYDFLRDVTAIDWLNRRRDSAALQTRFEVVYQLASITSRRSLSLKVGVSDGEPVPSLVALYPAADFLEREVFDLMGIVFMGHPDLRRILLSDDWKGHPLRKDYPVSGYEMWDWRAHV